MGGHAGGEEVEEALEQAQVLPCHVRHLEDWTHPVGKGGGVEVCGGIGMGMREGWYGDE